MRNQLATKPHVHVVSQSTRLTGAIADRLSKAGYAVSAGESEAEAMERVLRKNVHALICHVRGKGGGTFELLERLKQQHSDACVLLVGADREPEQVAGLVREGAFDYLTLPIGPGKLEASLRHGLTIGRPAPKLRAPSGSLRATNEELARERDTLKKWNDNLIAVNQLIQAISGTLSADEIVAIAAQRLAEFLSYDLFGATWWQPERVWVQTCGRVEPERAAATRSALLTRRRVRPGAEQTSSLGRSRRKAAPAHVAHRSWLIELPLTVAQEEYGLLRLEREHGTPFSAEDDAFLRDIAPSLAIALRNADVYTQVQNLAMTDGLTGLLNRRAFADHLARALRAGERYRAPTCLIMADLDHFKSVNDRLGHPGGDQVLKDVARLIGDAVRSVDIVARYGGEEFAMILPHTDLEPARVLAERIRKMLERHDFTLNGERTQITLSMGVARIPCSGIGKPEDWLAAADQALYRAKSAGRNRVVLSEGLEEAAPQVETNLFAVPTR